MASCNLTNIPPDIYKFLQLEQAKIKIEKGHSIFSIEATVYKLLRDYQKIVNAANPDSVVPTKH